jgi:hypothetical protein
MNAYKVISIDAWGNAEEGYDWNNWQLAGFVEIDLNASEQDILEAMVRHGHITYAEGLTVEDDQFNLVIKDAKTGEPFYAIEYGTF